MIDIHTHIGRLRFGEKGLSPGALLGRMDREGIEKAVVLSVEAPEELDYYVTSDYVLRSCRRYPDRLIPFCAVDPRHRYPGAFAPYNILKEYLERGAKGFGEHLAGIPVDDPMNRKVFEACGRLGLPVLMHFDYWINRDRAGLPGFERMLQEFPQTVFIAHGPFWWREMSGKVPRSRRSGHPKGKVVPGGRVEMLLKKHGNLFADLSADSGYNALTRDPDFGRQFLERYRKKLLFGTDLLRHGQKLPIIDYIKEVDISRKAFTLITRKNAERLLKL